MVVQQQPSLAGTCSRVGEGSYVPRIAVRSPCSVCKSVTHRTKRVTTHQQNTRTCSAIPKIEGHPSLWHTGPSTAVRHGQRGQVNLINRPPLTSCFYYIIFTTRQGCVTTCRTNHKLSASLLPVLRTVPVCCSRANSGHDVSVAT